MKTFVVALMVTAGALGAAEVSREFVFKDTMVGLPALKLSQASATNPPTYSPSGAVAPRSDQPGYFSTAPKDLITPASVRLMTIQNFQSSPQLLKAKAEGRLTPSPRKPGISYPISATDLIGRNSDREKLIEDFNARNPSKK